MKTIQQMIPQPLTEAIGYTILHSLWQGLVVAAMLTLAFLFLNRQQAVRRYRLALGALFLQLLLSAGTFWFYYSPATTAGQALANAQVKAQVLLPAGSGSNSLALIWAQISLFCQTQLPLIVTVWLLGIAFMSLRFMGGLVYLQRLRSGKNIPFSAYWQNKTDALTARLHLNTSVGGVESGLVKMPLVIGFFKPLIILPLGTLASLPLNQVEAILSHELAHIRRHDYFINLLQSLIEVLFFYHPAIWWVSDFVRVERENCCDDLAIAISHDKLAYAQALVALAEMKGQAPGLALAFAGKDGSVLGRIKRLFQQAPTKTPFHEGFIPATILILGMTLISAVALADYSAKVSLPQENTLIKTPADSIKARQTQAAPFQDTSDSSKKEGEVIIYQDKKGKIVELYIDGQKVPDEQLSDYKSFILKGPRLEGPKGNFKYKGSVKKGKVRYLTGTKITPYTSEKTKAAKPAAPLPPHPKVPLKPVYVPAAPAAPLPPRSEKPVKPVQAPAAPVPPNAPARGGKVNILTLKPDAMGQHPGEPLYMLNGKKIAKGEMNDINPDVIQSIDVLKDGAASIYGEAGKNGVVLITTKPDVPTQQDSKTVTKPAAVFRVVPDKKAITPVEPQDKIAPVRKLAPEKANPVPDRHKTTDAVLKELKNDNLYSNDKDYTLKITNTGMYINNVKQPDALFQKYRKYLPYPDKNVPNQIFEIKGRFTQE